jgi:hypothetical protein
MCRQHPLNFRLPFFQELFLKAAAASGFLGIILIFCAEIEVEAQPFPIMPHTFSELLFAMRDASNRIRTGCGICIIWKSPELLIVNLGMIYRKA